MSQIWLYSLGSVLIVSLLSFFGAIILFIKQSILKRILLCLVSFSAGALLGSVFLHLLPELVNEGSFTLMSSVFILVGILLFFVLEKILHWRHCHLTATHEHTHPLAFMNLVGDAVHNFIDGALIAGSYLLSIPVGIATTVAVIFHEIPQEMGDFGVLLHAGMKPKKALLFNFLSALSAVLGVLVVLGLGISNQSLVQIVIPITIGGFLYIANSDLIPELHKETNFKKSIMQLVMFLAGIAIMGSLLLGGDHSHVEHDDSHEHEMHEIQHER